MAILRRPRWALRESAATPERHFFDRRAVLKTGGAAALAGGLFACDDSSAPAAAKGAADPSAALYPFPRNEAYTLDRELTREDVATTYNNYYEFGSHKRIYPKARGLALRPWEIAIDGEVEAPFKIAIDDLMAAMPLEERLYRHRCVEAWAMAVPWSGFPMRALVERARPLAAARYVRMETFFDPDVASGQRQPWYPWPYTEGLTMEEATSELAFLATGIYGKPLPKQSGAPLRLAVPWKYGFKSIKGIVRFTFQRERPRTFWDTVGPSEYGFWANVNPDVPHPRWSQASEELIGTGGERVPTQLFNGYAEEVASLYPRDAGAVYFR